MRAGDDDSDKSAKPRYIENHKIKGIKMHQSASCFIMLRITTQPYRLMKTSSIQSNIGIHIISDYIVRQTTILY